MLRRVLTIAVALAFSVPFPARADDYDSPQIQVGRYITLTPDTALEQRMPLLSAVNIRLPSNVTWLRTALEHTLRDTGYSLASDSWHCPEIRALFEQPVIAWTQRRFERVSVLEILHALAGPSFVIQLDPVSRKIAFDLAPAFQPQPATPPQDVAAATPTKTKTPPATKTNPNKPKTKKPLPVTWGSIAKAQVAKPVKENEDVAKSDPTPVALLPSQTDTTPPTETEVAKAPTAKTTPATQDFPFPLVKSPADPIAESGKADVATATVSSTERFANPFLKAPVAAVAESQAYIPNQPSFRKPWEQ